MVDRLNFITNKSQRVNYYTFITFSLNSNLKVINDFFLVKHPFYWNLNEMKNIIGDKSINEWEIKYL